MWHATPNSTHAMDADELDQVIDHLVGRWFDDWPCEGDLTYAWVAHGLLFGHTWSAGNRIAGATLVVPAGEVLRIEGRDWRIVSADEARHEQAARAAAEKGTTDDRTGRHGDEGQAPPAHGGA